MPKFAANVSMLFTELPFLDRFAAAKRAGFEAVEFMFPYAFEVSDIAARLKEHDLQLALFNLHPGDWDKGERGIACLSDRKAEFRESVSRALAYARVLNCPRLHCLAGIAPTGVERAVLRQTYIENLRFAADAIVGDGVTLLIEPINTRDIPGYFLSGTRDALSIISEVDRPNLKLQYDCYHMHIMEGALAETIARCLPSIAHIQIADAPGRHEPGTGEVDYPALFKHLDQVGYAGFVGCEYKPRQSTDASLAWLRKYKASI